MSLSQALASAMSGLRANQIALGLVSSNVANAETPGYIKKTSNQVAISSGEFGASVRVAGINRELDLYLQRQLRTEMAGAAYANVRSDFLAQLQSIYGTPGSAGTLESAFNSLTTAVQALSTSSDSQSARIAVINAAQSLVQQLNSMTRGIQTLRGNAEAGLSGAVNTANNAMQQIANINVQLLRGGQTDGAAAELLDQRDRYIDQLSELMDVRVITNDNGQVNIFTNSGVQLVGAEASQLSFNAQGTVTANTLWSADPAQSNLGSITVNFPHGGSMDLFAANTFRSGKIAALVELRDQTLVEAQAQLDQFAAALASALSDKTVAGTAASSGAQTGFDLDLSGLQNGNVVSLTYTNTVTGAQHKVSIVRVDDASVLPLPNTATNDPNDQVIGIDFSGGMASVASQLNAALGGANISFSASGSTLTVLDDGAAGRSDINAVSARITLSSVSGTDAQLPLFKDAGNLYTGAYLGTGAQVQGFAGRIALNTAILNDPSKLVQFSSGTAAGDTTRPDFIYAQLTAGSYFYSPEAGLGTTTSPFKGTLLSFAQQFVSAQGEKASAAKMLAEGQQVVMSTLQQKFAENSGVNIDDEMAHLLALQNAYAANARVMSVVKEMYQALMQVM
ncbi:flagellar hook-associated protein FlgK [Bradyrhizobium sp. LHD-71]|uniref:flagellar hook-associated protein FlgK n=1 Tax=Bradyrhizobium sp. LHD-71 TaxID=3072141 RepID=UPI00280F1606|nr:flagellar hook-associated protein FlgK [Bradyrhizobium sp. LHD-71]MDQ8732592.1 flagellar hook-associated protein FlgK [Bradyrhizobium sp. LHD-71]